MKTDESAWRVLIVEDDTDIALAVRDHLAREGVSSEHFTSMTPVSGRLRAGGIDAIILDIMLPDGSGIDLCRFLRQAGWTLPILFLTARNEEGELVTGLEAGGDDYVTKPFSATTLTARVRALLRRATVYSTHPRLAGGARQEVSGTPPDTDSAPAAAAMPGPADRPDSRNLPRLVLDSREIDFAASEVRSGAARVDMTAKERHLLAVFVSRPNTILTRDQLFHTVWGDSHHGDPGTVAVHMRRLREKLEDNPSEPRFLQTVRGLGYRFRPDAEG
ncbi:MAG: response regulator transcription factor [Spirochaetales bacterium]